MIKPVLSYYNIANENEVLAFSTTRKGGVSQGNYGELNVNAFCGDDPKAITTNRNALCQELGIDMQHLIMPHQTHGTEIRQIAEDFLTLPENVKSMILEGVDAVMTNVKGICIGVSTADCIPILLYAPSQNVICAIHAGWRGTVAKIVTKAIAALVMHYHVNPNELKAIIGPGISLDSFEVGDEVYEQFAAANFNMEAISQRKEKWHIDLPACNRIQMEEMGVKTGNIIVSDICTMKNSDEYFSARKLGIESGRIFTGILLK